MAEDDLDDISQRGGLFGQATTVSEGTPPKGFSDPNNEYPKKNYSGESSINKSARGSAINNLSVHNAIAGTPLEYSPVTSSFYPLNQVDESSSGHIHEVNDTPGNERVLLKHNKGGGIDMLPDGTILIATGKGIGNRIEVVGGNYQMTVEGDGTVHYTGNMNMTVTGDYNLDVKGDYNVNVSGDQKVNIEGSSRNYIAGIFEQIVQGSFSTTVLGLVNNTYLSDFVSNVKGSFTNRVEGIGNYFHKGVSKFTSETGSDFSSKNTNIFADDLSVIGGKGTIGADDMFMHCKSLFATTTIHSNADIKAETRIHAPVFKGNLFGQATGANKANEATTSAFKAPGGTGSVNINDPGTISSIGADGNNPFADGGQRPNSALVTEVLSKSNLGIRKVVIDKDEGIKNSINQSVNTSGVSKTELSVAGMRSKLKNISNLSNSTFTADAISRGVLSSKFKETSPEKVGRLRSEKRTEITGTKVIGDNPAESKSKSFVASESSTKSKPSTILPERQFNAATQTLFKMNTKLTKRSSLAKFVAAPADGTNLKYVADQAGLKPIFRNLFPHAMIIDLFYILDEFDGYNLNVAEGIYVLGPNETVPATDTTKDLARVGRSITYELRNTKGEIDNEKTYDLAVYLKDNAHYDKLSLYYDTVDPNSDKVHSQIVVNTPAIPENYTTFFNMKVDTYYNFEALSNKDLVEVPQPEEEPEPLPVVPEPDTAEPDTSETVTPDAYQSLGLEDKKQVQEDQYLARPYGTKEVAEGGIKSTLNGKLFPNRTYSVIPDGVNWKIIRIS